MAYLPYIVERDTRKNENRMLKLIDSITLRDYQEDAINFSTSRPASLISLSTGTGKSICFIKSAIDLLNRGDVKKAIVFGTKSSCLELHDEMQSKIEYDDGSSFKPLLISSDESLEGFFTNPEEDVAIIQYEKLTSLDLRTLFKGLNKYPTAVYCDESQRLKTPTAMLTKCFVAIRKPIKYLTFLTATPIMSKLIDLFYQVQILDSKIFKNRTVFSSTFIEEKMVKNWKTGRQYPEIVGYKNLELMREKIKPICFDYYPKQDTEYLVHKCTLSNPNDYMTASEGLLNSKDAKTHGARLVDLQHTVDKDRSKIKLYLETIKPYLKTGLLTYVHYHETMDMLSKIFDKLNIDHRKINGTVSTKERREIKEWFNSDPSNKVLLISAAGSTSLNLQSVNNLFFYNVPQGIGAFLQARGRIVRLFSKHPNFKIHFITTEIELGGKLVGTVDAYKYELVSSYTQLTNTILEADEIPEGDLKSFNKNLMDKIRKANLWDAGTKGKKAFKGFE